MGVAMAKNWAATRKWAGIETWSSRAMMLGKRLPARWLPLRMGSVADPAHVTGPKGYPARNLPHSEPSSLVRRLSWLLCSEQRAHINRGPRSHAARVGTTPSWQEANLSFTSAGLADVYRLQHFLLRKTNRCRLGGRHS